MNRRYLALNFFTVLLLLLVVADSCKKPLTKAELKERYTADAILSVSADSLESYITWLEDMGTRFALADNRRDVALALREKFTSFGINDVRLDSFQISRIYDNTLYEVWEYNVIAVMHGSVSPQFVYILGGHYDSILREGDAFDTAPGANDNGSGVAAMLEVSRVLSENNFNPESTIEFIAFGSEELGLYGSWDYAAKAQQSNKNILLMLNNDMIAFEPSNEPLSWFLNIMDYPGSVLERVEIEKIAQKYTRLVTYNDNTYNKYSDSFPFSEYGYPSVFFHNRSEDPNYHTLDDVVINCNFDYCREVSLVSLAVLIDKNF